MRIAQVTSVGESQPGAAESIRALSEALEARGHDVTLIGPPPAPKRAALDALLADGAQVGATLVHLANVFDHARRFDLIHNHAGFLGLPFVAFAPVPVLSTPPGRLDEPNSHHVYAHYTAAPLVSLSAAQQVARLRANWVGTVFPAVALDRWVLRDQVGSYLVWYGRVAPDQRPDRAIDLAIECGLPLQLGGRIAEIDRAWFEVAVRPRLTPGGLVEWVGDLTLGERNELFGGALAMIAVPDRPDPFPCPAAEAMACGTPVVALRRGAYPELIAHGHSGLLADNSRDLYGAVEEVGALDRRAVRDDVARHVDAALAAERYERIYQRLLDEADVPAAERLAAPVAEPHWLNSRVR